MSRGDLFVVVHDTPTVARGPSFPSARGVLPDQGSNRVSCIGRLDS